MTKIMEIKKVRVTPEIAKYYLSKNNGNRKCTERVVSSLAGAIVKGEWI